MKKIILGIFLILMSLTFSAGENITEPEKKENTLESTEVILNLIKETEKNPAAEINIPNYEKIIEFSQKSNDVQVFLIDEIYGLPGAKISDSTKKILQGSYVAGALKRQLETGQKIITISDGLKNELKVYKILRETKYAKVDYLEDLLDLERGGIINQVYYDFDVMGMEIYQKSLGVPQDVEALETALKIPFYVTVSNEKVLVTNMSLTMIGDLSTLIVFEVVSDDYGKAGTITEKKAREVVEKLLQNETVKKIYDKPGYSGIVIQLVTPKVAVSRDALKTSIESGKEVGMKESQNIIFDKGNAKDKK